MVALALLRVRREGARRDEAGVGHVEGAEGEVSGGLMQPRSRTIPVSQLRS